MLIDNYFIDKKSYPSFPENLRCNFFSIDIKFICLSEIYIREIEKILKKYQISINNILNAEYVEGFLDKSIFSNSDIIRSFDTMFNLFLFSIIPWKHSSLILKFNCVANLIALIILSGSSENVFVGSNTSLVAPVKIEKNSIIGAGSVITENVNKNSLALARSNQLEIKNYKQKKKK